jgi:reductive dehalogenase
MRIFSHKNRPVHLGPFPLERLERSDVVPEFHPSTPQSTIDFEDQDNPDSLANAMRDYVDLFDRMRLGDANPNVAPLPDDLQERADHLKAACYYLDASMAGTCEIPKAAILDKPIENELLGKGMERDYESGSAVNPMAASSIEQGKAAWKRFQELADRKFNHTHALVIIHEYTRDPDPKEPGGHWLAATQKQRAAVRAAEVASSLTAYLRILGFDTSLHTITATELNFKQILLAAGLGQISESGSTKKVTVPYLGDRFGMAIVSTSMRFTADKPLAKSAKAGGWRWWLGLGGSRPGYKGELYKNRQFYLGPNPMEKVKHVDTATTIVDKPNIPRVAKRNDMFIRAGFGDLGPKAKKELDGFRFITKSPIGQALQPGLGAMVPLQYGTEAAEVKPGNDDPRKNSEAIKAALYYMGADLVGICKMPEYAWYSHDIDGSEILPYHKYGIAILVDQGYETMEGASGDDWISAVQSMRAYLRAQITGGIVGNHIRSLGYSARGHSVLDQDVLHMPLILESGLGELSRIGELVLNPFVGPRFKSGVITTDMPLEPDKPIDFGLQDFCNKCVKCARECPVTAISFGDKIIFNGYEMWKPDVEKCARYRVTNSAGAGCGRCMKTCPWNIEGVLAEKPFLWAAMHLPFTREWIAKLDDKVGNGSVNPVKKWWWNHDTDDDGLTIWAKKANQRKISFRKSLDPEKQKLACYPAGVNSPPASATPIEPDRKIGVEKYKNALSPVEYKASMNKS